MAKPTATTTTATVAKTSGPPAEATPSPTDLLETGRAAARDLEASLGARSARSADQKAYEAIQGLSTEELATIPPRVLRAARRYAETTLPNPDGFTAY